MSADVIDIANARAKLIEAATKAADPIHFRDMGILAAIDPAVDIVQASFALGFGGYRLRDADGFYILEPIPPQPAA